MNAVIQPEEVAACIQEAMERGQLPAEGRRAGRQLVTQLSTLGAQLAHVSDVEPIRAELHRLITKLRRHNRRMTEFAYDSVSLEIGGSG